MRESKREAFLWAEMWARPQAVAWEDNGQEWEVALFVRSLARAEQPSAPIQMRVLTRQFMDALGLTIAGMRVNRWTLGEPEQTRAKASAATGPSARDRLRLVVGEE